MKTSKISLLIIMVSLPLVLCLCCCGAQPKFEFWNKDAQSLEKIKEYVDDVTRDGSPNYIPKEDRIAVSDNDGTLYGEKAPIYYDCILYVYRVLYDNTYTPKNQHMIDLAKQLEKSWETHDLEPDVDKMISAEWGEAFDGMTIDEFEKYCKNIFTKPVLGFNNINYGDFFYKPMIELINYLREKGFELYLVTGVDRIAARVLCCDMLNIEPSHIIGTDSAIKISGNNSLDARDYKLKKDDVLLRDKYQIIKNTNSSKVLQIAREIGKKPVLSIGNSSGDESMATYVTTDNKYKAAAFMVLQNDNDRDNALLNKVEKNKSKWESNNWVVVSIKDDWATIYGNDVTKVEQ